MKDIQIMIVLGFVLGFFANSFTQEIEQYPHISEGLLWKVEGEHVQQDCYLFGTIHLINQEQFYFPKKLEKRIKKSEQVVLEISNFNKQNASQLMLLKQGSFFDYFTLDQVDSIVAWGQNELNMEPGLLRVAFDKLKPFAVYQIASQNNLSKQMQSYDLTINSIATTNEIPVVGLETIEQQIALFDNLDTMYQREMVMEIIRNPMSFKHEMQKMVDLYLTKNLDSMYQFIASGDQFITKSLDQFLLNRNKNWIPKIENLIQERPTFIAVGAGHLGGPAGVLRLLEKKGYQLTPVKL